MQIDFDFQKLKENWELNNKNKKFNELLNHSSQELKNFTTTGKKLNSGLNSSFKENSMAPLFPNISLRSTSPSLNQTLNQANPSLSRVSSPFLSRMMDLSNIIEPTLDDQTLKRRLISPQPLQLKNDQQQTKLSNQSSSSLQNTTVTTNTTNNNNNGAVPLAPLAVRSFTTPSSALFDYNDDNLLALSLTSMANSGNSSPRLRKPMLNSPIDHYGNSNINSSLMAATNNFNSSNNSNTLRPLFSPSGNNSTHQLAYETIPLSNNNRLLNNGSFQNNNINTSSPLLQSYPSNYNISSPNGSNNPPFIKRPKSSNIVTLNISRESSRSPISMNNNTGNDNQQQQQNQIITNNNNNNPSNNINQQLNNIKYSSLNQIENPNGRIPMDNNGTPITKKKKLNNNRRVLSSPLSGLATTATIPITTNTLLNQQPTATINNDEYIKNQNLTTDLTTTTTNSNVQPTKFTSEEVVVSKFGKVYVCQECKRQFSSGHHLTRHKKSVHSGEKPYSCPKCGKRFKRRDHVLQHLNKKIPCVPNNLTTTVTES